MAYISFQPNDYFNTKKYSGTGSAQSITGIGFQPDWSWIKNASSGSNYDHHLYDVIRGVTKAIASNNNDAETTKATGLTAFGSDGFTVGADAGVNSNGSTLISWNWRASGTSGSSNSDGSITSTVSVNTTAGFSIVKYTGTGSAATVGHGLGTTPGLIIIKNYSRAGEDWVVWHKTFAANVYIRLNTTAAQASPATMWNNTLPTSTVFSVLDEEKNNYSGDNIIAYCFAEKTGFSKFMGWSGNGSTDGTFLYTGFKPAFFIYKVTSGSGGWGMLDNKRDTFNPVDKTLSANANSAEAADHDVDFLSNGLKIRSDGGDVNASGSSYIGMAFAEAPIVSSNGVPAVAR